MLEQLPNFVTSWHLVYVTFLVTFAVMASGITSASTLSRAFGGDYLQEFISVNTTLAALVFVGVVAHGFDGVMTGHGVLLRAYGSRHYTPLGY
jgi:phosphatidylglycerophosphate synthase